MAIAPSRKYHRFFMWGPPTHTSSSPSNALLFFVFFGSSEDGRSFLFSLVCSVIFPYARFSPRQRRVLSLSLSLSSSISLNLSSEAQRIELYALARSTLALAFTLQAVFLKPDPSPHSPLTKKIVKINTLRDIPGPQIILLYRPNGIIRILRHTLSGPVDQCPVCIASEKTCPRARSEC